MNQPVKNFVENLLGRMPSCLETVLRENAP